MEDIDCPPCSCDGHFANSAEYCTMCDEPACMDCGDTCGECEMWICHDCMSNTYYDEEHEDRLSSEDPCPDCGGAVIGPIQGEVFCTDCGETEYSESVWWDCCGSIICEDCGCSTCNSPEVEFASSLLDMDGGVPGYLDQSSILGLLERESRKIEKDEDETKSEEARIESARITAEIMDQNSLDPVSEVMQTMNEILHRTSLSEWDVAKPSKPSFPFPRDGPEYREWWLDNSEKIREFLSMMFSKNGIISFNDKYFERHRPEPFRPSRELEYFLERIAKRDYQFGFRKIRDILRTMRNEMTLYDEYRSVWLKNKVSDFPDYPLTLQLRRRGRKDSQFEDWSRVLGPIQSRSLEKFSPDIAVSRMSFDWNPIDLRWEVNKSRNDLLIELKAKLDGYRDSQPHIYCGSLDCFIEEQLKPGWSYDYSFKRPPHKMIEYTVNNSQWKELDAEKKMLCRSCYTDIDGYGYFMDMDSGMENSFAGPSPTTFLMGKKHNDQLWHRDAELERRTKSALSKTG